MKVTLRFVLHAKAGANGLRPVYLRVTHRRRARYVHTGYFCSASQWDARAEKFKGKHLNKNTRNRILSEFKTEGYKILDDFRVKRQVYDFDTFKRLLLKENDTTINTYLLEMIKGYKQNEQDSTAYVYENLRKKLEIAKLHRLDFAALNRSRLNAFIASLSNQSDGTIKLYLTTFKHVVNRYLKEHKLPLESSAFYGFDFSQYKTRKRSIAISETDLRQLERYKPAEKDLIYKYYFLFSVYARGMNFKDMALLTHSHIKQGVLAYERQKTKRGQKEKINITVSLEMQNIIAYFKNGVSTYNDYIFPIVAEPLEGDELFKRIRNKLNVYNKKIKSIGIAAGISTPLSSYVARHTFANILRLKGVNIEVISQMLGHSDLKTTERYLASFGEDKLNQAARLVLGEPRSSEG